MKKMICLLAVVLAASGCATTQMAVPPDLAAAPEWRVRPSSRWRPDARVAPDVTPDEGSLLTATAVALILQSKLIEDD